MSEQPMTDDKIREACHYYANWLSRIYHDSIPANTIPSSTLKSLQSDGLVAGWGKQLRVTAEGERVLDIAVGYAREVSQ